MGFLSSLPQRLRRLLQSLRRLPRRYLGLYSELNRASGPRFKVEDSAIHGTGAFAALDIKGGQLITEYVGELIPSAEGTAREERGMRENGTSYIMIINDDWDLDGAVAGNDAKYLNHSCDPNCELEIDTRRRRAWFSAYEDIAKDDELTFDYSFDPMEDPIVPCKCGAESCRGYINEFEDDAQLQQRLRIDAQKSEG
jgi:hypothetical protein